MAYPQDVHWISDQKTSEMTKSWFRAQQIADDVERLRA
jgi:hypothetical protein